MKYLIANWKAQITLSEMTLWIDIFREKLHENTSLREKLKNKELIIIICPSFPFLLYVKNRLQDIVGIDVGGQNVSHVQAGKYTGEVTAQALKDVASFAIVGHSERRKHFNESEEDIERKILLCSQFHITPVHCVRSANDLIYEDASIIAFEPVDAIGTGENADVSYVLETKAKMNLPEDSVFLYGGSADSENIHEYLATGEVQGFLVGTASLDPREFIAMADKM